MPILELQFNQNVSIMCVGWRTETILVVMRKVLLGVEVMIVVMTALFFQIIIIASKLKGVCMCSIKRTVQIWVLFDSYEYDVFNIIISISI